MKSATFLGKVRLFIGKMLNSFKGGCTSCGLHALCTLLVLTTAVSRAFFVGQAGKIEGAVCTAALNGVCGIRQPHSDPGVNS